MERRGGPGKCCCGFPCLISDGDLDGTTCDGTWERDVEDYSTPNHATSDSDALWYDPTPRPIPTWQLSATANPVVTDQDPGPYNGYWGNYQAMIIGAVQDCDNFVFLRVTDHRPETGLAYTRLELGIVIAGVEIVLSTHVETGTEQDCFDLTTAAEFSTDWWFYEGKNLSSFDLTMCWDGTMLVGSIPGGTVTGSPPVQVPIKLAAWDVPGVGTLASLMTGLFAGVGTGTLSVEVTKVVFTDYNYSRSEVSDSEDVTCGFCEDHCCGSPVPPTMIVEIAGTITGVIDDDPLFPGTCDCDEILGTWFLSSGGPTIISDGGITGECFGDNWCFWVGKFDKECEEISGGLRITAQVTIVNGIRTVGISVHLVVDLGGGTVELGSWVGDVLTESPCDTWTDWIDLEIQGEFSTCDASGLTMRFKIVNT